MPWRKSARYLRRDANRRVIETPTERERKPEAARFAEAFRVHALSKEQILYPAALLVGECIRARLGK